MENSKLISLLKTFDKSEWRAFMDFLSSPFFNKQTHIEKFGAYLKKVAYQGFPAKKLDRKKVFKKVVPDQPFSDKEFNYLTNQTYQLALQFLEVQQHLKQQPAIPLYQLETLLERDLSKHYEFEYKKAQKTMESIGTTNAQHHYLQYKLAELANEYFLKQRVRKYGPQLQDIQDHLDKFYIAQKLKYSCEMLDRQTILSATYQLNLMNEIEEYLQNSNLEDAPSIFIYKTLYQLLTADQPAPHFQTFRKALQQYQQVLDASEMKRLFFYAINFCIRNINKGETQYISDLLSLYTEGIETDLLLEGGHLSPFTFKNVVKLGLRLARFDWTAEFIETNKNKLADEFKEDAYNYNLADLHYYRKEYPGAIQHLLQVEFSDVYYFVDSRILLAKIYYETNEIEALYSLFNSLRVYLTRNKLISANTRPAYLNFINLLGNIVKNEGKSSEQLQSTIEATTPVTEKT